MSTAVGKEKTRCKTYLTLLPIGDANERFATGKMQSMQVCNRRQPPIATDSGRDGILDQYTEV
jgi:hypothetical protein